MTGRKQNSFGDRVLMALVFLFLYAPIIILIVFLLQRGHQLQRVEGLFPEMVRVPAVLTA